MYSRYPSRFPRRPAPGRVAEPMSLFGEHGPEARAVTVSQFVAQLNNALRASLPDTWVRGEVGEWKTWSSGHAYFTLKDAGATLNAMMFADDVRRLPFQVEAGRELLARGRPNVYAPAGKLTFMVSELQPYGIGALQLALEQLKSRLQAEGLFDPARKRPLPLLPRRIGVVTSARGAAVRDILKVLSARFPNAHVTIYPVAVQGAFAAAEIARGVNAFSRTGGADVVIVARGGGSREDLMAFNDERVVRAVAASRIPTIAAVGHEVDVTLTDLAADVRAATPSQAAELVVARREELDALLLARERELLRAIRSVVSEGRAELSPAAAALDRYAERVARASLLGESAVRGLLSAVRSLPARYRDRLAAADGRLRSWPARAGVPLLAERTAQEGRALLARMAARVSEAHERLGGAAGRLASLDPLRVLARGYAVAYKEGDHAPLTDAARVQPGDAVRVLLARGEIRTTVNRIVPDEEGRLRRERDEG